MNDLDKLTLLTRYCEKNWQVFPVWWLRPDGVCACSAGSNCSRPGKHPRVRWQHPRPGESGATADVAVVAGWLRLWPLANWAVVCDDFFVLDVDRKHGGLEALSRVETEQPELLGITLTQETASGGRQLIYKQPPERDMHIVPQGGLPDLPGCEIKGLRRDGVVGSYVLIPPSAGRRWLNTGYPSEAPDALLRLVRCAVLAERIGSAAGVGDARDMGLGETFDWERAFTPGGVTHSQDDTLYRAALSLRSLDIPDRLAVPVLRRVVECFVNADDNDPWLMIRADQKWDYVKRRHEAGVRRGSGMGSVGSVGSVGNNGHEAARRAFGRRVVQHFRQARGSGSGSSNDTVEDR